MGVCGLWFPNVRYICSIPIGNTVDLNTRILMEGNLANEVGLVVLDLLELFCNHFKVKNARHVFVFFVNLFYERVFFVLVSSRAR